MKNIDYLIKKGHVKVWDILNTTVTQLSARNDKALFKVTQILTPAHIFCIEILEYQYWMFVSRGGGVQ